VLYTTSLDDKAAVLPQSVTVCVVTSRPVVRLVTFERCRVARTRFISQNYRKNDENASSRCKSQACRGYGHPLIYPRIYPRVDIRLKPSCGYISGYYAGAPAN